MTEKKSGIIQLYHDEEKILAYKKFILNGKNNYNNNMNGEYKEYYYSQLKIICNYKNEELEGDIKTITKWTSIFLQL